MTKTQTFVFAGALLAALASAVVSAQMLKPHADLTVHKTAAGEITMLHSTVPMNNAQDMAFDESPDKEAASFARGAK